MLGVDEVVRGVRALGKVVVTFSGGRPADGCGAMERSLRTDELDWIESTEEFAAAIEQWLERNVDQ